jgi:N-acetylglucosaminyldiphosphoundecaprenol N-acetyl-beta-D-mannosaminyltransferase
MKKQMIFTKKAPEEVLKNNRKGIFNFQNFHSLYLFKKNKNFREAITLPNNFIFSDGRILSLFLGTRQIRGPTFTKEFMQNSINKKQKHFFILPRERDREKLIEKFPELKNSKAHSPPYIQDAVFPSEEIEKIVKKLGSFRPDYVWVCVGNPKQEILSNQLYKEYPALYFNVGAAMDFLLGEKKESPEILRKVGLEWFYRLITDFRYSGKKVWRSLLGLGSLRKVRILNDNQ